MAQMVIVSFLNAQRMVIKVSNYQSLAEFYDLLTSNVEYQKRGEYFHNLLKMNGKTEGILVDLGCGTGSLCEVMSKLGYEIIGIDNSVDMLNVAMNKRYDSGADIMYLCQSMQELDLYGTMDICISALDSLNHITDIKELQAVFKKVSLFLHPQGIFIFDLNTIYKHQQVLSNNVFVYDFDEVYCVWQNTKHDGNLVEINLDIFCKDDDNSYSRMTENFCERAYSHEDVLSLISSTDLELVAYYAEDSLLPPTNTTERVIYIAKSTKSMEDN